MDRRLCLLPRHQLQHQLQPQHQRQRPLPHQLRRRPQIRVRWAALWWALLRRQFLAPRLISSHGVRTTLCITYPGAQESGQAGNHWVARWLRTPPRYLWATTGSPYLSKVATAPYGCANTTAQTGEIGQTSAEPGV